MDQIIRIKIEPDGKIVDASKGMTLPQVIGKADIEFLGSSVKFVLRQ